MMAASALAPRRLEAVGRDDAESRLVPCAPAVAAAPAAGAAPSLSSLLSVLTFNVLADGLAQNGAFSRAPAACLAWPARLPLLAAELARSSADLLCLQEVNRLDELLAALPVHYSRRGAAAWLPKARLPSPPSPSLVRVC